MHIDQCQAPTKVSKTLSQLYHRYHKTFKNFSRLNAMVPTVLNPLWDFWVLGPKGLKITKGIFTANTKCTAIFKKQCITNIPKHVLLPKTTLKMESTIGKFFWHLQASCVSRKFSVFPVLHILQWNSALYRYIFTAIQGRHFLLISELQKMS